MIISIHFTLLLLWATQAAVTSIPINSIPVALGDSLTLNCTYNCSSGFIRGCWSKGLNSSQCLGDKKIAPSSFCTISVHLSNVSRKDLNNYTCYTLNTDHPQLQKKTQRIVLLYVPVHTSTPDWTDTTKTEIFTASPPAQPEDSEVEMTLWQGEVTGIKVLATVTIAVAMVLAALAVYLCINRSRQNWNGKGEPVVSSSGSPITSHTILSPAKGSLPTQSERVTLRIPTPDNQSDTEVPYADIMITVRGASTPELTQICYLTPGDQRERWREESSISCGPRSHLQASRSADRLHVHQPREVTRKMSTNSEYAVITYA
ncbi:uncharacterized protein LOC115370449 [Myripristis murdjan]|uniref:uncharacterized protein LOC115370449 n=1 Tax=Myripristis murdjan TaxID=586833 RepID=UPI001175FCA6|nr:uncharacterized protein LOC115370449 [Myripristis murdjan]